MEGAADESQDYQKVSSDPKLMAVIDNGKCNTEVLIVVVS